MRFWWKFQALFIFIAVLMGGCANQQPPGGGEEDKSPPKVVYQYPKNNTLNYNGSSIAIEFDEYVDRRSFQDAFRISPPIREEISYEWSGKEVEIVFSEPPAKKEINKTFVVSIGSNLKDIRGNPLDKPIQFAFSTGPQIDKAGISGQVVNNDNRIITVLAYRLTTNEFDYNPTKNIADYITETNSNGLYTLTNLSPGSYRLIAVYDDDKNLLYTSEREDYGVLSEDTILKDSAQISNANFYIKVLKQQLSAEGELDTSGFYKDTLGVVYSSIENNSRNVLPDESILFLLNKVKPSREEFVNSFKLKNETGLGEKVVFNWRNDTLIEIITPGKLGYGITYRISFSIKMEKDSVYNYNLKFKTASSNSFGELKGIIKKSEVPQAEDLQVLIEIVSEGEGKKMKYSYSTTDTVFTINNVLEGDYTLFSFIDKNLNGMYDYGNPFPFSYSEPFYIYPVELSIKGGWAVENVIIDFGKYK